MAVFDEKLVSRFELLGDADPGVLCTPPMFIAFDVLQVGAHDVRGLPLKKRRAILEDAIDGSELILPARRLDGDGNRAWKTVERRGLEGFVAKDPESIYRSGVTRSWLKVKQRFDSVFIIGRIRDVDAFDGVLVGELIGDELMFRGVVEWGFRAPDVLALLRDAKIWAQRTSPFADAKTQRNVVWLEPRLRCEASYAEVSRYQLRAPVWRGLIDTSFGRDSLVLRRSERV